MREWISAFLVRYRDEVGRRPAVYTNANWWNDVVGDWAPTNTPLFLAAYQDDPPTKLPGRWWATRTGRSPEPAPSPGAPTPRQAAEPRFGASAPTADTAPTGIGS